LNKRTICAGIILFALIFSLGAGAHVAKSAKTITVPDDYSSIQAAVGSASSGDTVFVRKGSYAGGIALNKPITLKGEDAKTTIIVGGATLEDLKPSLTLVRSITKGRPIIALADRSQVGLKSASLSIQPLNFIPLPTFGVYINSSDVWVSGFTIMGGSYAISGSGDRLQISENVLGACSVGGNNITVANNGRIGLQISGVHNFIERNTGGLVLLSSNSTVFGNSLTGFELQNANSNTIINNTLTGSTMGLYIGSQVASGPKKCSYNLFAGNSMVNCGLWGILLGEGSYNVFFGNIVRNTGEGIGHDGYGLALGGNHLVAENNLFLCNIFVDNVKNFGSNWAVNGTNFFDDGKIGNYWDDYLSKYPNVSEVGQSGTGNIPYVLVGMGANVDNHPLLNQPDVSDKVPTLPEPWASLLSNSKSPSLPEFPSSALLVLLLITVSLAILIYLKRRSVVKNP
jgi:parallel beta-helix repeat protein